MAIEIDINDNDDQNDPSTHHIGVMSQKSNTNNPKHGASFNKVPAPSIIIFGLVALLRRLSFRTSYNMINSLVDYC